MGFQKDPTLHSGERVGEKTYMRILLTGWISFLNSDPSSSIETSPSWVLFLGLCLRTLVTLKLWAVQTHLQPDRVTLYQSESVTI